MNKYKKRRIGCFSVIALILIYGTIKWFMLEGTSSDQPFRRQVSTLCGTVVTNYTEIRKVKHGVTTDFYMKVDYGTHTEVKSVDGSTWYEYQAGSRVCFAVYEGIFFEGICLITTLILVIAVIFGTFVQWLIGDL